MVIYLILSTNSLGSRFLIQALLVVFQEQVMVLHYPLDKGLHRPRVVIEKVQEGADEGTVVALKLVTPPTLVPEHLRELAEVFGGAELEVFDCFLLAMVR